MTTTIPSDTSPASTSISSSKESPTPSRRRRTGKRRSSDTFFNLVHSEPQFGSLQEPTPQEEEQQKEPLLTRILLTPLLFTSFLISLFLINRSDRAARASQHPSRSTRTSLLSYISPTAWLDPEPYQEPSSSAWDYRHAAPGDGKHVQPHSVLNPEDYHRGDGNAETRSWYLHNKIRKVARWQVSDAFEMRRRVLLALSAVLVAGVVGVAVGTVWALRWCFGGSA